MQTKRHILVSEEGNIVSFEYETISPTEALVVFPEAEKIVKRLKTEYRKELSTIYAQQKKIRDEVFYKIKNPSHLEFTQELAVILHTDTARQIELEQAIEVFERMLNRVKLGNTNAIPKLKEIPITNYIDFNRAGFARCIWHNEITPSMKYYHRTNTIYCFGCHKSGDVIDVVQQLNNFNSVGEAIKYLSNDNR